MRLVLLEGEAVEGVLVGGDGFFPARSRDDDALRPAVLVGNHGFGEERFVGFLADIESRSLPDAGRTGLQPGGLLHDRGDLLFRQGFFRKGSVCRRGDGVYSWLVRKVLFGGGQDYGRRDGGSGGDPGHASPQPCRDGPFRGGRVVQPRLDALPQVRGNGFFRSGHEVPHIDIKLVLFHFFSRSLIISCNLILARWSLERVVASLRPSACAISLWE